MIHVLVHLAPYAAAAITICGLLSAINRNQDIGQLVQHPVRQVIQQRAVGLQLVTEGGKPAHDRFHHLAVERWLTTIERDIDFLAAELPVNEGSKLFNVVFQLGLRTEHVAHAH